MGYYTPDPYNQPEKFDLITIGEIEWSEPNYSFDTTAIWRHKDGKFYWASDSGCSCPSPFEAIKKLEDLSSGTADELVAALEAMLEGQGLEEYKAYARGQVLDMIERIRRLP